MNYNNIVWEVNPFIDQEQYWRDWTLPRYAYLSTSNLQESVSYNEDDVVIKLAVPGVKKKELEITVQKGVLTIKLHANKDFVSSFCRDYNIEDYDSDNADINLADGVLSISMDKLEEAKPKKLKF